MGQRLCSSRYYGVGVCGVVVRRGRINFNLRMTYMPIRWGSGGTRSSSLRVGSIAKGHTAGVLARHCV